MYLQSCILRLRLNLSRSMAAAALALGALSLAPILHAAGKPVVTVMATNPETGEVERAPGVFTFALSEPHKGPLTVAYALKGTAVNGVNYVMLSGTKVIKAGKTSASINVVYKGPLDSYFPPETVKLTLLARPDYVVGAKKHATVTIEFVLP